MSYDASKVAFVDTETTGLDPEHDYIWEIGVIVDGEEYVWQQRLPELDGGPNWELVSDWVLENTRIVDTYDHEAALTPEHSIDNLIRIIGDRHMVGACPWFDSERLHRVHLTVDPPRRDLPWHYHLIDVETLAVGYLQGRLDYEERVALDAIRSRVKITDELPWRSTDLSLAVGVDPADFEPKHSALADARWAKALYEKIMGPPR
jgi:DNA polymerase III epsilon subunit-like protein